MNEQQAIEVLKCFDKQVAVKSNSAYHTCDGIDACNIAIQALKEIESVRAYLEPLRNYNTHNEHLEKLKELVKN